MSRASDSVSELHSATREYTLADGETLLLRPLKPEDVQGLGYFLQGLSSQTRKFSTFDGYDFGTAAQVCRAINRYDKLRFVLVSLANDKIIGLLEFSLGIPQGDIARFRSGGIELAQDTDFRFGPTLADEYQNKGIGSIVFPAIRDKARRLGKRRVILWGGVLSSNYRAIRFYKKHGFKHVGVFINKEGKESVDMILEIN